MGELASFSVNRGEIPAISSGNPSEIEQFTIKPSFSGDGALGPVYEHGAKRDSGLDRASAAIVMLIISAAALLNVNTAYTVFDRDALSGHGQGHAQVSPLVE